MSNHNKGIKKQMHEHKWQKQERKLKDDFKYFYYQCSLCHDVKYPAPELQKIFDYKREHLFLTVPDVALLLLFVGTKYPEYRDKPLKNYIPGITFYQKLMFLFYKEIVQEYDIPTENPGFYGYKYGPYSDKIDNSIHVLIESGLIKTIGRKSTKKEKFYLTEKGIVKGKEIFNKLSSNQKNKILDFRLRWDEKKLVGLKKYVYSRYKEYTNESVILSELFPGRKLFRRRG
jgi:hypothetical protein